MHEQVGTTKGTGGQVLILEEAAYVDPTFFYETVAPLTIVKDTTLLAISTLTSEINFYTRLIKMKDPATGLPMFVTKQIKLACDKCIEEGSAHSCPHLLHLVPRWQASEKHLRLKTIMQDRPDLIQSELSGLAFDSLQQVFRPQDIERMFQQEPPQIQYNEPIYIFIDPAAGGPQSDYCVMSVTRWKGMLTVRCHKHSAHQKGLLHIVQQIILGPILPLDPVWDHQVTKVLVEACSLVLIYGLHPEPHVGQAYRVQTPVHSRPLHVSVNVEKHDKDQPGVDQGGLANSAKFKRVICVGQTLHPLCALPVHSVDKLMVTPEKHPVDQIRADGDCFLTGGWNRHSGGMQR